MVKKVYYDYNTIHKLIQNVSDKVKEFKPEYILAISGGGFIPARILRTYINVPLLSVGINYYNDNNEINQMPKIVQWLDEKSKNELKGKRVLICDEIDDTRKTLAICIKLLKESGINDIGVMVIHNKKKEKLASLDIDMKYYYSAEDVEDVWIVYAYEVKIEHEHENLDNL